MPNGNPRLRRAGALAAGLIALAATGCANLPEGGLNALAPPPQPAGSPTELYTRLARGAMTCWFASGGALHDDYIYEADAEPASRGGASKIVVHKRDTGDNPRGVKAFEVAITPVDGNAGIEVKNYKLPEPLARDIEADVRRWAEGDPGCRDGSGWAEPETRTGTLPAPAATGTAPRPKSAKPQSR